MKQTLTYFIMALFVGGCSTSIEKNNPSLQFKSRSVTRSLISPAQNTPPQIQNSVLVQPVNEVNSCANYELSVKQAVQALDLETLEGLLVTLNRQPDCPISYLDAVKRSMAQIAAARGDELTQQSQLAQAQTWLKRAPTMVWGTQAVHGDIAAHRHQWQTAAQFYNQAVDLLADPQATPKSPKPSVIKKVYHLASEAQILAGRLDTIIDSSGKGSGMMRDQVRGVVFKKRLIPIPFESGKITLDEKDQHAVQRLATYLKQKNAAQVTLIGHTDSNGSHALNDNISKQRALAVKKYLQNAGVITRITTIAKGKREPLQLANRAIYVPDEIDVLNRRVEFIAY